MYALWSSIGRDRDPFIVVPAIPRKKEHNGKDWTDAKIRREILNAETKQLSEVGSDVYLGRRVYLFICIFRTARLKPS